MPYQQIDGVRVVAFTGAALHGKDTAAKAIATLEPGARLYAFSDAVAVVARVFFDMKQRNPDALQHVGTEGRSGMLAHFKGDPDVWVRCLYHAIEDHRPSLAIITGVRYPNEAQMVRDMGGAIIRVIRSDASGTPYAATDRDLSHPVEQQMAGIAVDDVLRNSGSADAFTEQVQDWWLARAAARRSA